MRIGFVVAVVVLAIVMSAMQPPAGRYDMCETLTEDIREGLVDGPCTLSRESHDTVQEDSTGDSIGVESGESYGENTMFALMTKKFDPMHSDCRWGVGLCDGAIEIVDLETMTHLRTLYIGERIVTSLAISPDYETVYITDKLAGEVVAFNSYTGVQVGNASVIRPRDSVLSADGSRLFVTSDDSIVMIETSTFDILKTLKTSDELLLGIALSLDGNTLGTGAIHTDENKSAFYLVDTSTLALKARIEITNPIEPDFTVWVNDVAFTDMGRALLLDSVRDAIYQVDIATATQLKDDTVPIGEDDGQLTSINNLLHYSVASGKAYALRMLVYEDEHLVIMTPSPPGRSRMGGFNGTPFLPGLTSDGKKLLVSVFHRKPRVPDTLDELDTLSETITRSVYTFSLSNMSVRDMTLGKYFRPEPEPKPCPLSKGFWKNHPASWPVSSLQLGSEAYDQTELMKLLRTPPRGDASLILAHQLIAAKLNVENGTDPEPINSTILDADTLLGTYSGKLPYGVHPSTMAGQQMTAMAEILDHYNNKLLTPDCRLRDEDENSSALSVGGSSRNTVTRSVCLVR